MAEELTKSDIAKVQQIFDWIRKFKISGPLVSFKNSLTGGCTVFVDTPFIQGQRRLLDRDVLVKLTGAYSGIGAYSGNIWMPPTADIDTTAAVTEATFGSAGVPCVIVFSGDVGRTASMLASSGQMPLILQGRIIHTNSDGKPVVAITGPQWKACGS